MIRRGVACVLLWAAAFGSGTAADAPRWRMKLFHDEDKTELRFVDLQAPAPGTALGLAFLAQRGQQRPQSLLVRTSDEGKTWQRIALKDPSPTHLFCLNQREMWLAGESIWKSVDGGSTWTRLSRLRRALRLHFFDSRNGIAVGVPKSIWTTADGGENWTALPDSAQPAATREYAGYSVIAFRDRQGGLIVGGSRPPRRQRAKAPSWMDPDSPDAQWPTTTLVLETTDGGKTWQNQVTSLMGQVTQVVFAPNGIGLSLLEFDRDFEYASEVFRIVKGKTERVFRDKKFAPRDLLITPAGIAWIAAVEIPGKLTHVPIPGKVTMFSSLDQRAWMETPIDYRASANRVYLAGSPNGETWIATDTGMILKLE